jgi:hypothetical protein
MESDELARRARRAYELGRVRRALGVGLVVLPLTTMSLLVAHNPLASGLTGAALLVATVTFRWRGQALGAAVAPGLLAGLIPFSLLMLIKCSAGYFCMMEGCMVHCLRFCGGGGLAAGLLLAVAARRREEDVNRFLLAAGVVAALTGLLGCFIGGVMGAVWMALGETAATLPAVAWQQHRRS